MRRIIINTMIKEILNKLSRMDGWMPFGHKSMSLGNMVKC